MGTLTMSERLGRRRLRRIPLSRPRRPAASSKKVSAVSRTEPSRSVCGVLSPAMSVSLLPIEDDRAGTAIRRRWRSRPPYPLFILRGVRLATGHATPLRAHRDALLDAPVNPDAVLAVEERAVGPAAVRARRFPCVLGGRR